MTSPTIFPRDDNAVPAAGAYDGTSVRALACDSSGSLRTMPGTVVPASNLSADETITGLKTSAGVVYGVDAYNAGAAGAWIQFFNKKVADITLGVTAPFFALYVPPGQGRDIQVADAYDTAISYAVTTTASGSVGPTTHLQITFRYI